MRTAITLLLFFAVLAGGGWAALNALPDRHNPLAPLALKEPPGWATGPKLAALARDPERCFAALEEAGVSFTRIENEETGERCGFRNALVLDRSLTPYSAPIRLKCGAMVRSYLWERHHVRPLAEEMLGSQVSRILSYGTYSCRNIAGSTRRSQHATANAIDIAGVELEDGRVLRVLGGYREASAEGEYLRTIFKRGCGLFNTALGPDYNAAHADHFHFDQGPSRICR